MHARLRGSKLFTKLYLKPDFPSLEDGIAEPHPDINIKVAAFTVSEKSSNTPMLTYILIFTDSHTRGGGGGGGEGGGVIAGNFGTGVRVSFFKPTPIIYLVFEKMTYSYT